MPIPEQDYQYDYVGVDADMRRVSTTYQLPLLKRRAQLSATCTANNTHVTATYADPSGALYKYAKSTGNIGFKGTKRGTPYAAEILAASAARLLLEKGVQVCDVVLTGPGRGRNVIVKGVTSTGRLVETISEGVRDPHNGCRPKKPRRV